MKNNVEKTFKRYEYKYLLTAEQKRRLMDDIENQIQPDKYFRAEIKSIYYDTPEKLLIRRSLDKPIYKEKLRMRSYGRTQEGEKVFVELKRKYDGVVYKRRETMSLEEAVAYLDGARPEKETQITREIDYFRSFYGNLEPSVLISYSREAYIGAWEPCLRITFDKDILWRDTDLDLTSSTFGRPLLPEGSCLMEVKIPGAMPLWLAHELNNLRLFKTSFSKYGNGYHEITREDGGRRVVCA